MTWMDSHYRVHMLAISMMDCDQDVRDMVGDTTYVLQTGCGVGPILWAVSAWLALVDYITGSHIPPDIDRDICIGACRAIAPAVQGTIDNRTLSLNVNKEDNNYD